MDNSNRKKYEQLGMPLGTANGKLRKAIIYNMMCRLTNDLCYRCGEPINSPDDMSIEHKEPWLDSDDPVGKFFNLDNIAFSHLNCNIRAGDHGKGIRRKPDPKHGEPTKYNHQGCRCLKCTKAMTEQKAEWRRRTGKH